MMRGRGSSRKSRPEPAVPRIRKERSEFKARVIVAIPALAAAIGLIIAGGWVFTAAALILGLLCCHELFRLYEPYHPIKLAGFLALIALAVVAQLSTHTKGGGRHQILLVLLLFIPVLFLFSAILPRDRKEPITLGFGITTLAVVWIGMGIAHAILLRELPHGGAILANILIATFVGDTAAYLGGKAIGRHRLAPTISPNKTIEGTVLGIVAAIAAAWAAGLYEDWLSHGHAILIGVVAGLLAPLGDLFESQVKRDVKVKDTGSIFGAHGGALDRLDAVLFTVVGGYYVWLALL